MTATYADEHGEDERPEIYLEHKCQGCGKVFIPIDSGPFAVTTDFCSRKCARRADYNNRWRPTRSEG